MTQDFESNRSLYQKINHIGRELISIDPDSLTSQFLPAIERINTAWQTVTVEILSHSRDYDELVKCAEKYNGVKEPLDSWLSDVEIRIERLEDIALDISVIEEQVSQHKVDIYIYPCSLLLGFLVNEGLSLMLWIDGAIPNLL